MPTKPKTQKGKSPQSKLQMKERDQKAASLKEESMADSGVLDVEVSCSKMSKILAHSTLVARTRIACFFLPSFFHLSDM